MLQMNQPKLKVCILSRRHELQDKVHKVHYNFCYRNFKRKLAKNHKLAITEFNEKLVEIDLC